MVVKFVRDDVCFFQSILVGYLNVMFQILIFEKFIGNWGWFDEEKGMYMREKNCILLRLIVLGFLGLFFLLCILVIEFKQIFFCLGDRDGLKILSSESFYFLYVEYIMIKCLCMY